MMPRAPAFWSSDTWLSHLLSPLSAIGAAVTARRVSRPGWRAPVPVICCGNVTVGGAGKTTLVLDLAQRLIRRGAEVHILSRGYGGSVRGPHRVGPGDSAAEVGDEALLLAATAPTWIGADRAASARAAVAAGARLLLMDDGLQNPGLRKDVALLTIDGAAGFGNGRVLPAGPLREPVTAGAARCQAAVLIGPDLTGALARLPEGLPVLRADLVQGPEIAALRGVAVLAFAGIARPEKFFSPLAQAGAQLIDKVEFPDHHFYKRVEMEALLARAERLGALAVTTPKDAARLPADLRGRVHVIGVGLAWHDEAALEAVLFPIVLQTREDVPHRVEDA